MVTRHSSRNTSTLGAATKGTFWNGFEHDCSKATYSYIWAEKVREHLCAYQLNFRSLYILRVVWCTETVLEKNKRPNSGIQVW